MAALVKMEQLLPDLKVDPAWTHYLCMCVSLCDLCLRSRPSSADHWKHAVLHIHSGALRRGPGREDFGTSVHQRKGNELMVCVRVEFKRVSLLADRHRKVLADFVRDTSVPKAVSSSFWLHVLTWACVRWCVQLWDLCELWHLCGMASCLFHKFTSPVAWQKEPC